MYFSTLFILILFCLNYKMKNASTLSASLNPFKLPFAQTTTVIAPSPQIEIPIDQTNNYLQSLVGQYRKEIFLLKQYISRINTEIRKNLNIQIPSLEEGFKSSLNQTSAIDQNVLNEWLNRLINVDYINPLLSLYDTHINNLEQELEYNKSLLKKYDSQVADLVNENNTLRQALEVRNREFSNFLAIKTNSPNGESTIVIDREYMTKLEERCGLLSKENEILAINYHNLQKELYDIKLNINENFKNNNEKAEAYDQLYQMYVDMSGNLDEVTQRAKTNEVKMFEMADKANKAEIENESLKSQIEELKHELATLTDSNNFYKNLIDKVNATK